MCETKKSNNGRLIVLSGPSGVGKGTICRQLTLADPSVCLSVSLTTRTPRSSEIEGESYFFLQKEEFKNKIEKGEFLEWACYNDNYYGTSKNELQKIISSGRDVLLEIDVQGALNVKEIYPTGIFIFILPPNLDVLKNRLIRRSTESSAQITKRMERAQHELSLAHKYDYVVVNDDLDSAIAEVLIIIKNSRRNTE